MSNLASSEGVRLSIIEAGKAPYVAMYGWNVMPGQLASFSLKAQTIKKLDQPYAICHNSNLALGYKDYTYSRTGCYSLLLQKYLLNRCGCVGPSDLFDIQKNVPMCLKLFKDEPKRLYTRSKCLAKEMRGIPRIEMSACPLACEEIFYDINHSTDFWPKSNSVQGFIYMYITNGSGDRNAYMAMQRYVDSNERLLDKTIKNASKVAEYKWSTSTEGGKPPTTDAPGTKQRMVASEWVNKNFLAVDIYFEVLHFQSTVQMSTYSLGALLSDIGGMLGLWIGMSILSGIEIVDMLTTLVAWFISHNTNISMGPVA